MTRAALFIAGAVLCLIPATAGVINGVTVLGLSLVATSVVTHIVIERHQS